MRIGVFDSGFGGLTVFRALRARLPAYDYVYLGDNARTPYGQRSFETVYRFTAEAVRDLFARDCALIVIACNTASAKALRNVQQRLLPTLHPDRRVLGIIRPSVEALAGLPQGGCVALWATPGTVQSGSYALELQKLRPDLRLISVACPLLVPLVENGELEGPALDHFLRRYWQQALDGLETESLTPDPSLAGRRGTADDGAQPSSAGRRELIDALLLGCTHYPLLIDAIRRVVPPNVAIVEQGAIVAPSLVDYLVRHPEIERRLSRGGQAEFLTTDTSASFDHLAELFLGHAVVSRRVDLSERYTSSEP